MIIIRWWLYNDSKIMIPQWWFYYKDDHFVMMMLRWWLYNDDSDTCTMNNMHDYIEMLIEEIKSWTLYWLLHWVDSNICWPSRSCGENSPEVVAITTAEEDLAELSISEVDIAETRRYIYKLNASRFTVYYKGIKLHNFILFLPVRNTQSNFQ